MIAGLDDVGFKSSVKLIEHELRVKLKAGKIQKSLRSKHLFDAQNFSHSLCRKLVLVETFESPEKFVCEVLRCVSEMSIAYERTM